MYVHNLGYKYIHSQSPALEERTDISAPVGIDENPHARLEPFLPMTLRSTPPKRTQALLKAGYKHKDCLCLYPLPGRAGVSSHSRLCSRLLTRPAPNQYSGAWVVPLRGFRRGTRL